MKTELKEGDLLAYSPSSIFGWIIAFKTWHKVSHVEIYLGNYKTIGSRHTKGVGTFSLDEFNIEGVYRPKKSFDLKKSLEWYYKEAIGQKYDWKGILGFINFVEGGDRTKMFCSEFATRFYERGGLELFAKNEDADKVAPFQLTISPAFEKIL